MLFGEEIIGFHSLRHLGSEKSKLVVVSDYFEPVARIYLHVCRRYVVAHTATYYRRNHNAVFSAEVELGKRLSRPSGIVGHIKFGKMYLARKKSVGIKRFYFAVHLSLQIARMKVLEENPFYGNAVKFDAFRTHR